jgi:hypothetical protein
MSRHQGRRMAGSAAVWLALLVVAPSTTYAQIDTGSIAGVVSDQTGGTLPGVTVVVTSLATAQVRTTVTNDLGRYQVSALQPSRYSVKVELSGFATVTRADVIVNVGSVTDINVTLGMASLTESITVSGQSPLVESTKTDISNVVTQDLLDAIPSRSRQYLDFTLLMPATSENTSTSAQGTGLNIGGARAAESSLLVDGFYNLDEGFAKVKQRYSEDSMQEFQIISFGGSAEYGRAIGGIVNGVTKSGSNRISGTGYGFMRNENLNAMDFGSKRIGLADKPEFRRQQWGATLGGPIVKEKSFFFGAYERAKEDSPYNDSVTPQNAAAIGLLPEDAGNIPQFYRLNFAMGKWDHTLSNDHRLQASFAISRWAEFNQSAVPFRTLSAEYGLSATDLSFLGKWTGISGGGKRLQELKVSYFPRYYKVAGMAQGGPPLVPAGQINLGPHSNASPPRVTITSVATFGSAALNNAINTYPVQAIYTSTRFADRHTVKFGVDYMYAQYDYTLYSPLSGSYSFSSLANFQRGAYTQYTQSFGDPHNPRNHQYLSGFVEDSWQAHKRLTLNYGLRYDLEVNPTQKASGISFGNDYNNLGPRFGLSYDLTGHGTTFAKMSSGLYYDRLFQNLSTFFTSLKDHSQLAAATWRPGEIGAPVYPNVYASPPANIPRSVVDVWLMPDPVKVPTSAQIVGTLDRALGSKLAVSSSVVYTKTMNRPYVWDNNLTTDSNRPFSRVDPTYRGILQYRFSGEAEYLGGIFEAHGRAGPVGFNANLTLARAYETTSNYSNLANDQRVGIDADWGPQTDTPRIRGVASAWWNFLPTMQVSGSFRARSGIAVNPSASGIDLNGDGNLGDRTPGLARNSFRGPGTNQLDLRYSWTLPLGGNKLQFYLESFNVLNHENVLTVNGDYGANPLTAKTTWMQPLSWAPPREVQLGARISF